MKRSRVLWALLLIGAPGWAEGANPEQFRASREILRSADGGEDLLAVTLDSKVYAATRDGLPDLRIFDEQGVEVPYLLEKVTENITRARRETCPSKVLSLKETDDGGIEVVVRLEDDVPPATGLEFHTRLVNYQRRVGVAGSNDGQEWTTLTSDALIVDYTRYMDVRNREVRLPENRFRQFRVSVAAVTDEQSSPLTELTRTLQGGTEQERIERTAILRRPFRMERIEMWREIVRSEARNDKLGDHPAVEYRCEEDPKEKATIVHVRTQREPLVGLALVTGSRNFNRAATVQVPVARGVRTEWDTVGRGIVSLLDFRGLKREGLSVSFSEQRQAEYRLLIRNEDSPPLEITGVQGRGRVYRAVFLAGPNKKYRLAYDAEEIESPRYDTAAIAAALGARNEPVVAGLGEPVAQAGQTPGILSLRSLLNNRIFLGAMVCLMVAVLGWGLYQAGRRIDNLPKE